jgi:hypothetical protein
LSGPFSLDSLPAAISPPETLTVYLEVAAEGDQAYECVKDEAGSYAWVHKGPQAQLFDADRKSMGKHYSGPTWGGPDGGIVVGAVKASVPAPKAAVIPWLLLDVQSTEGEGVFTVAKAILRVNTSGGVQPDIPCTELHAGSTIRVPYTATYLFLK